jgi:hypothetical protein
MVKNQNNVITKKSICLEKVEGQEAVVLKTLAGTQSTGLKVIEQLNIIKLPKMYAIEKKLLIAKLHVVPVNSHVDIIKHVVTKEFNTNRRLLLRASANLPDQAVSFQEIDGKKSYTYSLPMVPEGNLGS